MDFKTLDVQFEMQGQIAVVGLSGEISAKADENLRMVTEELITHHPPHILLDLKEVDYINSSGIALLIRLIADARKANLAVSVAGLTEHYTELFHITRLTDYIRLFRDRETAVQTLSRE